MRTFSVLALMVALAACSAHSPGAHAPRPAADSPYNSLENGKRIFQTGRDLNGKSIVATHKPLRASCAACHGVNGAGGMRIKDNVVSADLRHRALVTDQKPPYTLPLLERAISQNIDNQGKPLDPVMPRWRLSQRDLHDVAEYVLTQLK